MQAWLLVALTAAALCCVGVDAARVAVRSRHAAEAHGLKHFHYAKLRQFPDNVHPRFQEQTISSQRGKGSLPGLGGGGSGGGDWWVKNLPWWMPAPPEWGRLPPTMYSDYYHNVADLPRDASPLDFPVQPPRNVENMERPFGNVDVNLLGKQNQLDAAKDPAPTTPP